MDCTLAINTTACSSFPANKFFVPPMSSFRVRRIRSRRREALLHRTCRLVVSAAKDDEPKLDQWDRMELKFGRFLGEDPKLTIAKIMARKVDPDASLIEVEKSFYKNKGKIEEMEEFPFDVSGEEKPSNSLDGLNLIRPIPKVGHKFQAEERAEAPETKKFHKKNNKGKIGEIAELPFEVSDEKKTSKSLDVLNLVRPVPKVGIKFQADEKPKALEIKKSSQPVGSVINSTKRSIPNVILRKPTVFTGEEWPSKARVRIKPNLSLKMRNDQNKEKFTDMTLLRKPEPISVDNNQDPLGNVETKVGNDGIGLTDGNDGEGKNTGITLLKKPETVKNDAEESSKIRDGSIAMEQQLEDGSILGMQPLDKGTDINEQSDANFVDSSFKFPVEPALQGKPMRLYQSVKKTSISSTEDTIPLNPKSYGEANELKSLPSTSPLEDADWSRAEDLLKTGNREEVQLLSSSIKGFVVSFGSLIGFLPYRNLVAKWKFTPFESWLSQKGLNPSVYKQNVGITGSYYFSEKSPSLDSSIGLEIDQRIEGEVTPDLTLKDLIQIYDQEKLNFLSSFVGQRIRVNVAIADQKLGKLIVSLRPKETEESHEKKRNLMATLQVGDVVKCCIKKITSFGIFVEVEGVPALIHQTELSWDATLDPSSCFKVGQIVDAKVHQLDFTLERIFLSLKQIMPDPLTEALEFVVGDHVPLDGRLQVAEVDNEWADVESLIKELQQIDGIQSVSKARFFLSPGLAPTFQVYMASMFENQYKLLARSGNKVQEVVVHASLDKEEMKSTILSCTNRVE